MDTRTTRLPTDLIEAAEAEGAEQHRSASKQLEHWARFGMYLDLQTSTARRRIERAVAGEVSLSDLSVEERLVANAVIDAGISSTANATSFADRLAARGISTVSLDDDGAIVRRHPDGSTSIL